MQSLHPVHHPIIVKLLNTGFCDLLYSGSTLLKMLLLLRCVSSIRQSTNHNARDQITTCHQNTSVFISNSLALLSNNTNSETLGTCILTYYKIMYVNHFSIHGFFICRRSYWIHVEQLISKKNDQIFLSMSSLYLYDSETLADIRW